MYITHKKHLIQVRSVARCHIKLLEKNKSLKDKPWSANQAENYSNKKPTVPTKKKYINYKFYFLLEKKKRRNLFRSTVFMVYYEGLGLKLGEVGRRVWGFGKIAWKVKRKKVSSWALELTDTNTPYRRGCHHDPGFSFSLWKACHLFSCVFETSLFFFCSKFFIFN